MHQEPQPDRHNTGAEPPTPDSVGGAASRLAASERALYQVMGRSRESVEAERALLHALQGGTPGPVNSYRFHSLVTTSDTVVCVVDSSGLNPLLKYIFAETAKRTYIVAVPISWTEYHRDILARVTAACGEEARCTGGGFLRLMKGGRFWIGGDSTEFGKGDHLRAEQAFGALLHTPREGPV